MLIDISRTIDEEMLGYPGDPAPTLLRDPDVQRGGEYGYTQLAFGSHCGTHLDAPSHFIAEGADVDQFSLEQFCPLVEVLDCRGLQDIAAADIKTRVARDDTALLLRTDASGYARKEYIALHPAVTPDAAEFLVSRRPRLLGIDYLSVERGQDGKFPVHRILLGAGFLLLEDIDLSKVEPGPYRLICLPLKLAGTEAAPCRAVLTDADLKW